MFKRLFSIGEKSWKYSFISLLNVGCGLSVTALIWYKYSATAESDILLLATSSISILAALSLVGVEQVMYFYADERKKSQVTADHFFGLAFSWSLLSGALFAGIVVAISTYFLRLVAPGFTEESRGLARYLLVSLSPQLVITPALHVLRAKWSLEQKFGRAYMLSAVNALILLTCLLLTLIFRVESLKSLGQLFLLVLLSFVLGFIVYNRAYLVRPSRADWLKIKDLMIHSSVIKGANSIHNFLVQALISSVLSHMPTGAISIYQYAKRLADGVFAITAGPQVLIYHSRCANAVSHGDLRGLWQNAIHFIKSFLAMFFAMAFIVYILTPIALSIVGKNVTSESLDGIRGVYLGIVLWYLIMGIETLSVGIILATRSSMALFSVNATFILLFFTWSRLHQIDNVLQLVFTTTGFQCVSFCLFTISALLIIRRRGFCAY